MKRIPIAAAGLALLLLLVTAVFTVMTWAQAADQQDQSKQVEQCTVTYDTTNLEYNSPAYKATQVKYDACVAAAYGVSYAPAN